MVTKSIYIVLLTTLSLHGYGQKVVRSSKSKSTDLVNASSIDSILKILTAAEYDLFIESTQLTIEEDDLDNLGAKVYSSGVKGLYTLMEHIVMYNVKNEVWAAVIDDQKVYYYTNNPSYYSTLPQTIEHWRQRFKHYPVIYRSAK